MKSYLALGAFSVILAGASGAALAQREYTAPPVPQQRQLPQGTEKPAPETTAAAGNIKASKGATKALIELQAAVNANDVANIPAKIAAAQAVSTTPGDRYIVAQLQLKAAAAGKNEAAMVPALETMLDTGLVPADQVAALGLALGKIHYNDKQFDKAAAAFERVLTVVPADADALLLLAETRNSQGRTADAVANLHKALQAKVSTGQKAPENWYKRGVSMAYEAKLPAALEMSRKWLAAYPTSANWRDAISIYRTTVRPGEEATLDALRLARATGALSGDSDYHIYAYTAVESGSPAEARAVMDEAIAAQKINPTKAIFREIDTALKSKLKADDHSSLAGSTKSAVASPSAKLAMKTGDAYYGYGEYQQAAELYRAALGKSDADQNLVNLRLGMALARAGDKAGAASALNAVTGPRAELAKYWLVYLGTQS